MCQNSVKNSVKKQWFYTVLTRNAALTRGMASHDWPCFWPVLDTFLTSFDLFWPVLTLFYLVFTLFWPCFDLVLTLIWPVLTCFDLFVPLAWPHWPCLTVLPGLTGLTGLASLSCLASLASLTTWPHWPHWLPGLVSLASLSTWPGLTVYLAWASWDPDSGGHPPGGRSVRHAGIDALPAGPTLMQAVPACEKPLLLFLPELKLGHSHQEGWVRSLTYFGHFLVILFMSPVHRRGFCQKCWFWAVLCSKPAFLAFLAEVACIPRGKRQKWLFLAEMTVF